MRPCSVSSSARSRNIRKIGITTTTGGMNRVERMKNSWSFLSGIGKREYAHAAGTPSTVAITVDAEETITEFLKPSNTGESVENASLKWSSVGEKLNTLAGTA